MLATLLIAVVVAVVVSIVSPLVQHYLAGPPRRAGKDAAAHTVTEATRTTATATTERLLAESRDAAATARTVDAKLDVIHNLVNSNMSAAMQNEADAITRELAMMQEVIELKKANGVEPNGDTLALVEQTSTHLAELRAQILDRTAPEMKLPN